MHLSYLFLFVNAYPRIRLSSEQKGLIKHEFTVAEDSPKQRLDQYVVKLLPEFSRSFICDLCESGQILVNEKERPKNYKVNPMDVINISITTKEASKVTPENIPLDIIYEDDHIIAINKPPGMVVHPAPGSPNGTFVNALMHYLGEDATELLLRQASLSSNNRSLSLRSSDSLSISNTAAKFESDSEVDLERDEDKYTEEPEEDSLSVSSSEESTLSMRPGVVHRLDKGTSGVLLAGKHPEAVMKMSELFAKRQIRKLYLAICVGNPGEATIIEPIGRCRDNRQLMTTYEGPPGKPSTTHVRTMAFDGKLSVALARIETGRTHQIRVHLKYRRTPVIGDGEYGAVDWNRKIARSSGVHRPLLHAYETQFIHPFTGEDTTITAPVPDDITQQIQIITTNAKRIIDDKTSLLLGPTDVVGKLPDEANIGLTSLESIRLDEEDYTAFDLPVDPAFFGYENIST